MLITTRETPAYSIHCGVNKGTTKAYMGDINSITVEHSVAYGATSASYESESSFDADPSFENKARASASARGASSSSFFKSKARASASARGASSSSFANQCNQRKVQFPDEDASTCSSSDVSSSAASSASEPHDPLTLEQSLDLYKNNKEQQEPSPTSAASSLLSTRLVSSLKKKSSSCSSYSSNNNSTRSPTKSAAIYATTAKQARPPTQRRIRGIWSEHATAATHLDLLRNETLSHILSFLPLTDLLRSSMVGRRWRFLASQDALWKRVDATQFIQQAHATFYQQDPETATQKTCQALQAILKDRTLDSLHLQDIGHQLSADIYLPALTSLQELTLAGFDDLTDTHLHVMLLMFEGVTRAAGSAPTSLRKLVLQDCPQLSNATIRSIATRCTHLEEISLKGNPRMDDLEPLANLLVTVPKPTPAHGSATMAALSLQSFFAAPPKVVPSPPSTEPTTPPRPASPPTHALQSLFAPPGMSPPRKTVLLRSSTLVSTGRVATHVAESCKLKRLDLDLDASSVIKCLQVASANNTRMVQLQSISCNGDRVTDPFLKDLAHHLDLQELQELDLSAAPTNTERNSSRLSNRGLQMLVASNNMNLNPTLSKLTKLNLSGHSRITGSGLACLLMATPKLVELNVSGCKGLSSDADGMVQLCKVLSSSSTSAPQLQLETLYLQGCFSTKAQAQLNVRQFAKQVKLWLFLRDTLCQYHQRLVTLNVNDCFGVRPGDIFMLRQSCPQLVDLQYHATCAWDKQQQQQQQATSK
jgi:hypothetical protein